MKTGIVLYVELKMIKMVFVWPGVIIVYQDYVKIYEGTCYKAALLATVPF